MGKSLKFKRPRGGIQKRRPGGAAANVPAVVSGGESEQESEQAAEISSGQISEDLGAAEVTFYAFAVW